MRSALNELVSDPRGVFVVLSLAAVLEALGDSCFQSGLHRTSGVARVIFLAAGVVVLSLYGVLVNVPSWQFGKLLGVYVVFFFLVAQILAGLRFHEPPTLPIVLGGSLIAAGGLVISLWKR